MYVMFWLMIYGGCILPGRWKLVAIFVPLVSSFIYWKVTGEHYTFTETQKKWMLPIWFTLIFAYVCYLEYF